MANVSVCCVLACGEGACVCACVPCRHVMSVCVCVLHVGI